MIEVPDWEMTDECFVHIPDEQGGWVAVCFQDIFTESWQYLKEVDHIWPQSCFPELKNDPGNLHKAHKGCQRRQAWRVREFVMTAEQKEARSLRMSSQWSIEQRQEHADQVNYSRTPDERKNLATNASLSRSPEKRREDASNAAKIRMDSLTEDEKKSLAKLASEARCAQIANMSSKERSELASNLTFESRSRGGREGGLKSGHTRGHVRKGIKVPGCEFCCGSS